MTRWRVRGLIVVMLPAYLVAGVLAGIWLGAWGAWRLLAQDWHQAASA